MAALTELARHTEELSGLTCRFECPEPIDIDDDTEATHLYRIANEAVNNALRHANASSIRIRFEMVSGHLTLEVTDDGIGAVTGGAHVRGVGLHLMEHRCGLIGGSFAISRLATGGTSVTCSVPGYGHPVEKEV